MGESFFSIRSSGANARKNCAFCKNWCGKWVRPFTTCICFVGYDNAPGAVERARVARELHDGAVQSLIAMEMQVDVVRRQSAVQTTPITAELGRIQGLLREEVLKLRELMQQMKSLDVDASNFLRFIEDTAERFQRETGIGARFVSEVEEVHMPQRVCREMARIVQEGLVNVRKHSGARDVLVRLSENETHWQLTIEDNGRGFPFTGRLSQQQLEEIGKGPMVIRERVRLIEGELTIESNPSRGARLEIECSEHRDRRRLWTLRNNPFVS